MIAENLKRLRKEKGLSQKEVSKKIGMTPQGYQQYERGVRNPKPSTIKRIADALGVTASEIFGETLHELVLPAWIPCRNKLPEVQQVTGGGSVWEESAPVIVCDKDEAIRIACYEVDSEYDKFWVDPYDGIQIRGIIAWMPLPEPYKEENNDNNRETE